MPNTAPYEVIAAPFTLFRAPVGEAFPDVTAVPAGGWVKVGSSGPLNYDRDAGVTLEHRQTTVPWRSFGDAGARKTFRSEEDLIIRLTLVDLTPEQYALGLNDNTVTTAGGTKTVGLSRGFTVATHALLIRGEVSPLGPTGAMQYEIPIAAQQGSPSVVYKNSVPAGIALEWMALVDPTQPADEYFGRLVVEEEAT